MAGFLQELIDAPEPEQPNQSEQHLEMVNPQPASVPDWLETTRFLTDVTTAAGLLEHGRRDKGLARRIGDFVYKYRMLAAAPAAPMQSASLPNGWKLVPVEPTPEMLDAVSWPGIANFTYSAMLEAAPEAPAVQSSNWCAGCTPDDCPGCERYNERPTNVATVLALLDEIDRLLAALTEIAELDILKYHHAYAIAKGAIEEIEALKCSNS